MIEKMIQNDVLQEIDWDQITNKENIGEVYLKSCEGFDPGNKYCVPYTSSEQLAFFIIRN